MARRALVGLALAATGASAASLAGTTTPPPLVGPTGAYSYRGSASGAESLTVAGDPAWTPTRVEVVVEPLSGSAGSCGIVLHHQDDANHYLFLASTNSNALMLYKKVGGAYTLLDSTPFTVPLGEEHVLEAEDAGGGELNLYWDGALAVSVDDTTFSSGRVGLRVWNMTVDFDDVVVLDGATIELLDDFEDGDAAGWTAGNGWSVAAQGGGGPAMPVPSLDASFEGGNGELTLVDTAAWEIRVRPELKGSSPYRAWFFFELSNLSTAFPTTLVIESPAFFNGAVLSYDGVHWQPLATGPGGAGATQTLTFRHARAWIAHSIPYLAADAEQLFDDVDGPNVTRSQLATSEGGRSVDVLRITGPGSSDERCGVWLVARNHAWEASGSWIADELVRFLASGSSEAALLLSRAEFFVVPILDVDSVALGASGKDQLPIDFNRDWRASPHWTAVGAAIDAIDAFAAGRNYEVFLDSHCPGSATTFLAVQPRTMLEPDEWANFRAFQQSLVARASELGAPYAGAYEEWGPSYHPLWYQMSFWHQRETHRPRLSLTLETATGARHEYRAYARALGRALADFVSCPPSGLWIRRAPATGPTSLR